ncbi:MAG: MBL fold metallo-hydrolase, partial [Candidatus Uhrbacteria bacterium]|nr:MBL fold metallo-hydrolase [Candidatus Uhrbacteria bacterium]
MRITFYGAVEDVTGSCFLVETNGKRILVDCGMHQGERMCSTKNSEPFGFDPKHIDAVFVTHAHFDHTGRLPDLVKQGYHGPIFMTPPTAALSEIVLADSVNVMRENAEKCGDVALYGLNELKAMLKLVETVSYHAEFAPVPGVKAMFHDAGHILGSSYISLDAEGERIVFSGDLGNDDVPILPATDPLHHADIVVCESTYGDKEHDPVSVRGPKLAAFVKKVIGRKGTIIIPAFSIERTQELLYELDQLLVKGEIPAVPIYLDSPLAIRATGLYRHFKEYLLFEHPAVKGPDGDFFSFPTLRETLSSEESKLINDDKRPKIIIAGNGMMTGGRVLHHLKRYLSDERAGLLIVGFQAPHTMGRKVQDGATSVKIYGDEVAVRATVERIEAFSAHADQKKLTKWLKPEEGKEPKIFLVHGENPVKERFAEH